LSLALLDKKRVFVHCAAGIDRTGLVALATFLSFSLDLFDALKLIEELRFATALRIEQKIVTAQLIADEVNLFREEQKGILAEAYSRRFKELYSS
jgi:protein-tyrosine phosphatase